MAEQLKDLIEKIQQEGVLTAQKNAEGIEAEAKKRAEGIIKKAEDNAKRLIIDAETEIARIEKGGEELLKQAGRNLLLTLRREINATLDRIVISDIEKALKPSELIKIITLLIKESKKEQREGVVISINKSDLAETEKGLMAELGKELKNSVTLKSSDDIRAGFVISFDKEKSHYDFTDSALALYISNFLKPKLAELLKESVPENRKRKK